MLSLDGRIFGGRYRGFLGSAKDMAHQKIAVNHERGAPATAEFFVRNGTTDSLVINEVWAGGCYTKDKRYEIKPNMRVLDVGAHIGGFVVLAAKFAKAVYAYEALPDNYELLEKNVSHNSTNVRIYNKAVTGYGEDIVIRVPTAPNRRETASFRKHVNMGSAGIKAPSTEYRSVTVSSVKLKDVLDELGYVDVLKMDCEGSEHEMLQSLEADDFKKIGMFLMEFHGGWAGCSWIKWLLTKNGFFVEVPKPDLDFGTMFAKRS